jgi:hypothetical protein
MADMVADMVDTGEFPNHQFVCTFVCIVMQIAQRAVGRI